MSHISSHISLFVRISYTLLVSHYTLYYYTYLLLYACQPNFCIHACPLCGFIHTVQLSNVFIFLYFVGIDKILGSSPPKSNTLPRSHSLGQIDPTTLDLPEGTCSIYILIFPCCCPSVV